MSTFAASLYVFHRGNLMSAYFAGTVSGLTSDYIQFRNKIVDKVVATGDFNKYERNQLCSGPIFLGDSPPSPPSGQPLDPSAPVTFVSGKCIVLDIRSSE